MSPTKIAVIVPSYKVQSHILSTLERIGPEVSQIYVVDDACPEGSGRLVQEQCRDPRVTVMFCERNQGVGGATLAGFQRARADGCRILVKLDGDGQMDPALIPRLVRAISLGQADYAKGSRFHSPRDLQGMPVLRLVGNAGLSFLAKMATGHWTVMDPTNGFIALHASLLPLLEPDRIAKRYFFETDLLFRLGLLQAAVKDVPMPARYADERSNLSVTHSLLTFPFLLAARTLKRLAYRYFLRDFNVGSVLLCAGLPLFLGGVAFGAYHWVLSIRLGQAATSGTVMVAALPSLLGFQMLTFALLYDVMMTPRDPIYPYLDSHS